MRISVLNPPWQRGDQWGIRAGCRFPNRMARRHNSYVPFPFLVAYTAAYLEREGHRVQCIDGVAERRGVSSVLERLASFGPSLVVAETATASLAHDLDFLAQLRRQVGGARVALYGPHVSARPEDGLACEAVDYVVRGEPEQSVAALAAALAAGEPTESLPSLSVRTPAGIRSNPRRALLEDIDTLPHPRREGMPLDKYHVPGFPTPVAFVYGSRGCPHPCSFCLWPQTQFEPGRYRPRAPERIAAELQELLGRHPRPRSFFFDDDTFNLGRTRLMRFVAELAARGVRRPWGMNARADGWDRDLLRCLKESGLFTLRMGIESGDPAVLSRCGKGLDLDEARATLHVSHELGIANHVSFVVGLAGESWDSLRTTLRFIDSVPVDSVQFSLAVPFPGTACFADAERRGLLEHRDWSRYSGSDTAVMRTLHLTASELEEGLAWARRRTYGHPRFVVRRLRYVRDPRDLLALGRKFARLLLGAA